jgi:hypothetical protein
MNWELMASPLGLLTGFAISWFVLKPICEHYWDKDLEKENE